MAVFPSCGGIKACIWFPISLSKNTAGFNICKINYWSMFHVLTANLPGFFSNFAGKMSQICPFLSKSGCLTQIVVTEKAHFFLQSLPKNSVEAFPSADIIMNNSHNQLNSTSLTPIIICKSPQLRFFLLNFCLPWG